MAKGFSLLSLAFTFSFVSLCVSFRIDTTLRPVETSGQSGPLLSSPTNDTPFSIGNYTNKDNPNNALIVLEIILKSGVFIYSCLAIALMCDEYFVPALELIGNALSLPSDITGAILIPFGTSGPEIFSSAVGVFFAQNDIGTGGIIGSAVFNLLAIPASCGLAVAYFIGTPIKLETQSILRDLVFYIISITVMILVIKDNRVDLIDASMMLFTAALYISIMIYNAKVMNKKIESNNNNNSIINNEKSPLLSFEKTQSVCEKLVDSVDKYRTLSYSKVNSDNKEDTDEPAITDNCILKCLLMPMSFLFWITMPKRWVIVTFVFSILWLSGLSYFTVWSVSGISDIFNIPQTISGMTILAAGSAVPDLVTSIIVIRKKGLASMGICGAIASNIFAILIGLGLPWIIKCIVLWSSDGYYHANVIIQSNALPYTSMILLVAVFAFMAALKFLKWELFKKLSIICALIHVIFLVITITLELKLKN